MKTKKFPKYRERSSGRLKLTEVIPEKKIEAAIPKGMKLKPNDRLCIKMFLKHNGSKSAMSREMKLSREQVDRILKHPRVRRAIKKSFNRLGISLGFIGSILRDIMLKEGDAKTDFNKLKAADIALKIVGGYAAKKVKHKVSGSIESMGSVEVKGVIVQLVKVLQDYGKDSGKFKRVSEADLVTTAKSKPA